MSLRTIHLHAKTDISLNVNKDTANIGPEPSLLLERPSFSPRSLNGISGVKICVGTGFFFQVLQIFPITIILPMLHAHSFI